MWCHCSLSRRGKGVRRYKNGAAPGLPENIRLQELRRCSWRSAGEGPAELVIGIRW